MTSRAAAPRGRRWLLILRLSLAFAITIAFVVVVARRLDLEALANSLSRLGTVRIGLGLAVIAVTILLRAVRLCTCLGERPGLELVSVSIVHNALVAIVPAKLGELGLPAMLVRLRGTAAVQGLGILVLLRGFDLLALGAVGGLSAALAYGSRGNAASLGLGGLALISVLGLALVSPLCRTLVSRWPAGSGGRLHRVFVPLMATLARLDRQTGTRLAVLSVAIWVSLFTSFYIFTGGIDPASTWPEVAVEGTAGSLAFALPINGLANLGPFQAAWVAAGSTLGRSGELALISALLAHGAVLVVTLLLAILAGLHLLLTVRGRPSTPDAATSIAS